MPCGCVVIVIVVVLMPISQNFCFSYDRKVSNITDSKNYTQIFLSPYFQLFNICGMPLLSFVMELSSIELRYLVNDIRSRVISGSSEYYVSDINAITKSSLFLRLHHPMQEDIMLVLSTRGIWITRRRFKPMEENNGLEKAAQKEIERARLELIEQVGRDRKSVV